MQHLPQTTVARFDDTQHHWIDETLQRWVKDVEKRRTLIAQLENIAAQHRSGEFASVGETPDLVTALLADRREFEEFRTICETTLAAFNKLRPSAQGIIDGLVSKRFHAVTLDAVLKEIVDGSGALGQLTKPDGTDWATRGRGAPINWPRRAVAANVGATLLAAGVPVKQNRDGPWAQVLEAVLQAAGDDGAERDLMHLMRAVIEVVTGPGTKSSS